MPDRMRRKTGKSWRNMMHHRRSASGGNGAALQDEKVHEDDEPQLLKAVDAKDLEKMKALIGRRVDCACDDELGNTPLHLAAASGWIEGMKCLMTEGVDKELVNDEEETPLHVAIASGEKQSVELLLKAEADVGALDCQGNTPLHVACVGGHVDIAELLISKDAECEAVNEGGETPLHSAAKFGGIDSVSLLLKHRVSIDCVSNLGDSPLHVAARFGKADIVCKLLNAGANQNLLNKKKESPLHLACKSGNAESVAALLKFKSSAVLDLTNEEGKTPLHEAAERPETEIACILFEAGADIHAQDAEGRTPYELIPGHCTTLEFLKPEVSSIANASYAAPAALELDSTESVEPDRANGSSFSTLEAHDDTYWFAFQQSRKLCSRGTDIQTQSLDLHEAGHQVANGIDPPIGGSLSASCGVSESIPPIDRSTHPRCQSLNAIKTWRQGRIIGGRYEVTEGPGFKESERFATHLETKERVRLCSCREESQYTTKKLIHELVGDASYVSKLIESIQGKSDLHSVFVMDSGYHTLNSVVHQKKLDLFTIDHVLMQVLLGLCELHSKGIVYGSLQLDNIVFYVDEHRWKLANLEHAENFGTPLHNPPSFLSAAHKLITGARKCKQLIASPDLDMYAYGILALTVLTGEPVFDWRILSHQSDPSEIERIIKSRLAVVKDRAYRELLDNLLLSDPVQRWSSACALRVLQSWRTSDGSNLGRRLEEIEKMLRRLTYKSSLATCQLACMNVGVFVSFKHARTQSSSKAEETEAMILHDSSMTEPIFALEIGESYSLHTCLEVRRCCQTSIGRILRVEAIEPDGTLVHLYTESTNATAFRCEARTTLDLKKFRHDRLKIPSPKFASPEIKFPSIELIITFTSPEEHCIPIKIRQTVYCCMFPRGSKLKIQSALSSFRDKWSKIPQIVRDAIGLFPEACNTSMSLVGTVSL